jgi:hypothetical protein
MQEIWQILAKMVTNMEQASGRGRATWVHRQAPPSPTRAPPSPLVATPCQWSMGATPQPMGSLHSSQFDQGLRLTHGGLMGPFSYTLSSPPTYQSHYVPNFTICRLHNRHWGATSTLVCKGGASKGRQAPICRPQVATDLTTAYKYPPCLSTL